MTWHDLVNYLYLKSITVAFLKLVTSRRVTEWFWDCEMIRRWPGTWQCYQCETATSLLWRRKQKTVQSYTMISYFNPVILILRGLPIYWGGGIICWELCSQFPIFLKLCVQTNTDIFPSSLVLCKKRKKTIYIQNQQMSMLLFTWLLWILFPIIDNIFQ